MIPKVPKSVPRLRRFLSESFLFRIFVGQDRIKHIYDSTEIMKKEERLTPEMRRNLSLVYSVRTMLRRNEAIKLRNLGLEMTDERRRQLIAETEKDATDFALTLQTLLLFMTEEEKCDYLDGLKHIVTG